MSWRDNDRTSKHSVIALALLTVAVVAGRSYLALVAEGPRVHLDEWLYKLNAEAIFQLDAYATAHYPPFYSMIIAPALSFDHWYEAMLILSSIASSLVVPATWMLARTLNVSNPMVFALLAALLPMHAVYAQTLMSENVGVPLFVLATALAMRGRTRDAFVFGLTLALLHLTKYLYLPALPVLFLAWLAAIVIRADQGMRRQAVTLLTAAMIAAAVYAAIWGAWLVYAQASGSSPADAHGLNVTAITSGRFASELPLAHIALWVSVYLAYILLAWLPAWMLVAAWSSNASWRRLFNGATTIPGLYVGLTLVLVGGYWLLALQHSMNAGYNIPNPLYLIGRYLMHLTPLMIVLTGVAVDALRSRRGGTAYNRALVSSALVTLAGVSMWLILYQSAIWPLPKWFAAIPWNSVDVFFLSRKPFLLAMLLAAALATLVGAIWRRPTKVVWVYLPWISVSVLVLLLSIERMTSSTDVPAHGRGLVESVQGLNLGADKVTIYLDRLPVGSKRLKNDFKFWGVSQRVSFVDIKSKAAITCEGICLIAAEAGKEYTTLATYLVGAKQYAIYLLADDAGDR